MISNKFSSLTQYIGYSLDSYQVTRESTASIVVVNLVEPEKIVALTLQDSMTVRHTAKVISATMELESRIIYHWFQQQGVQQLGVQQSVQVEMQGATWQSVVWFQLFHLWCYWYFCLHNLSKWLWMSYQLKNSCKASFVFLFSLLLSPT